jgi:RNA polymerase sigma-70 factor, ECF subfamily
MVDQTATTFFNRIYDETYKRSLWYVTKKCSHAEDIADILQEVYTEVYSVIAKKGIEYVKNPEAFVMQVTKAKVYKHYSLSERLANLIPLFVKREDDEEFNVTDYELSNDSIEEHLINSLLLDDVAKFISAKPNDVQKVFYMFYFLELTIPQIAHDLSMKESNVKSKIYRTVREVRKMYGKDGAQNE